MLEQYRNRPVVVGLRPEDMEVDGRGGPGAILVGDVELVEALGSEQLIHFRTDATALRSERTEGLEPAELNDELNVARVDPRVKVAVGDRVPFAIAPERIEFFDPDTGAAIRD